MIIVPLHHFYPFPENESVFVEVTLELFLELDDNYAKDKAEARKRRRHGIKKEFDENKKPRIEHSYDGYASAELRMLLQEVLPCLTEVQLRRVLMRCVLDMRMQDIAAKEGVHIKAIQDSIASAFKILSSLLMDTDC